MAEAQAANAIPAANIQTAAAAPDAPSSPADPVPVMQPETKDTAGLVAEPAMLPSANLVDMPAPSLSDLQKAAEAGEAKVRSALVENYISTLAGPSFKIQVMDPDVKDTQNITFNITNTDPQMKADAAQQAISETFKGIPGMSVIPANEGQNNFQMVIPGSVNTMAETLMQKAMLQYQQQMQNVPIETPPAAPEITPADAIAPVAAQATAPVAEVTQNLANTASVQAEGKWANKIEAERSIPVLAGANKA